MDKDTAISVEEVTKIYRLYDKPIDRLKESMSLTHKSYHRDFFALDKLSFTVKKGETVGIIGTNGSGKSTILKIITGVLTPTTGKVEVDGKISALLELGAGFNPDYTGIENIYMNGTMMGFSKQEMDRKLDDILTFADIGDFVKQPVKTYSSGMFVRLAFALAINVDPEILIVDEALSVGDLFFQAKCYRRMEEMMKNGTTILMVSHDMGSIIKYCDKVVLLNRGKFIAEGPAGKMVDLYKKILANQLDDLERAVAEYRGAENAGPADSSAGGEESAAAPSGQDGQRSSLASAAGPGHSMDGAGATGASGASGTAGTSGASGAAGASGASGTSGTAGQSGAEVSSPGDNAAPAGMAERIRRGPRMRDRMTLNPQVEEYGDGRAEFLDLGTLDKDGNVTNLLLKGEMFTIREIITFHAPLEMPIFTFTIRDRKGTDLTGTNTMFEGCDIRPVKPGDVYEVRFKQKMTLQGGEYLLSMSCTGYENGEHVVYHRLYNVAGITVISNKNTVGFYDMESEVSTSLSRAEEDGK